MSLIEFKDYGAASRDNLTLRVNKTLFISNAILKKNLGIEPVEYTLYVDDEKENTIGIELRGNEIIKEGESIKKCRPVQKEKSGVSINFSSILRYLKYPTIKCKLSINFLIENKIIIITLPRDNNAHPTK